MVSAEAQRFTPEHWERTQGGGLKHKSYINTVLALRQLGAKCCHDTFHNKKIVEGDVVNDLGGELSDPTCRALRDLIIWRFRFDPGIENVQQATERACEVNRFDPVSDYLNALSWDGKLRIDNWLITYLGAEDTPFNRSIGRKVLIAAVRRVRKPGCKFDYVLVLEGPQGAGKSSALRILAGEENFSDQPLVHLDTRSQQEAMCGVWIYELSELAGLRRTDIETLKSFLSKTADNARPAYGRYRTDQPRQCIFIGTTNDTEYLRDNTGNRRFWPVSTGLINLQALECDRDQLWAEAVVAEAQGEALVIPEDLYATAADQQDRRLMKDLWEDMLAEVKGQVYSGGEERISSHDLLVIHLRLSADKINDMAAKRLKNVMQRLGWFGPKKIKFEIILADASATKKTVALQGYWRPARQS